MPLAPADKNPGRWDGRPLTGVGGKMISINSEILEHEHKSANCELLPETVQHLHRTREALNILRTCTRAHIDGRHLGRGSLFADTLALGCGLAVAWPCLLSCTCVRCGMFGQRLRLLCAGGVSRRHLCFFEIMAG